MIETLLTPDTLTQAPFYETNKVTEVAMSFEEVFVTQEDGVGLPPSPYIQAALMSASVFDRRIETADAFGAYTEISKGISLEFVQGYSRYHEELYAACGKDPAEFLIIDLGNGQLHLAIRGEDSPRPSRPSVELLFQNTAEEMEANKDTVSKLAQEVSDEFSQRYKWGKLEPNSGVNVYFRENDTHAWDVFEL